MASSLIGQKFEATLQILGQMKQKEEVFISLSPPYYTSFEIDRAVLRQYLRDQKITESEFKKETEQISMMLLALLIGETDSFAERFIEQRLKNKQASGQEKEVEKQRIEAGLATVKAQLYDEHLQGRYNLKKSSKAPSFNSIDWDIKVKHADAQIENLKPFPYATCRISFQKDFDASPFQLFSGKAFDSAQINFSVDEITYLLRVLTTIKERLEKVEKEVA